MLRFDLFAHATMLMIKCILKAIHARDKEEPRQR